MGNLLQHKCYKGTYKYDKDSDVYWGWVINTVDLVLFQADTLEDVQSEFELSVDSWLAARVYIDSISGDDNG